MFILSFSLYLWTSVLQYGDDLGLIFPLPVPSLHSFFPITVPFNFPIQALFQVVFFISDFSNI